MSVFRQYLSLGDFFPDVKIFLFGHQMFYICTLKKKLYGDRCYQWDIWKEVESNSNFSKVSVHKLTFDYTEVKVFQRSAKG